MSETGRILDLECLVSQASQISLHELVGLSFPHSYNVYKFNLSKPFDKCMEKVYACMHVCMITFKYGENMEG
jgi:hypothetical protein